MREEFFHARLLRVVFIECRLIAETPDRCWDHDKRRTTRLRGEFRVLPHNCQTPQTPLERRFVYNVVQVMGMEGKERGVQGHFNSCAESFNYFRFVIMAMSRVLCSRPGKTSSEEDI